MDTRCRYLGRYGNVLDSGAVCVPIRPDRRGPQGNRNVIVSNHVTFLSQDSRLGLRHFLRQNSSCSHSLRCYSSSLLYDCFFLCFKRSITGHLLKIAFPDCSVSLKSCSFSCIINLHHKILFTFLGTLRRVLVFLARMEFL